MDQIHNTLNRLLDSKGYIEFCEQHIGKGKASNYMSKTDRGASVSAYNNSRLQLSHFFLLYSRIYSYQLRMLKKDILYFHITQLIGIEFSNKGF